VYVTIAGLSRLVGCSDVFAKVIEDDRPTGARKPSDGLERLVERLAGDESSRKAISPAQARDRMRYRFFCGEPEDQIAQRVRGIGLFSLICR
jgi:hypothetical protein